MSSPPPPPPPPPLMSLRDVVRLDEAVLDSSRHLGVEEVERSRLYLLRRMQLLAKRTHKVHRRRGGGGGGGVCACEPTVP